MFISLSQSHRSAVRIQYVYIKKKILRVDSCARGRNTVSRRAGWRRVSSTTLSSRSPLGAGLRVGRYLFFTLGYRTLVSRTDRAVGNDVRWPPRGSSRETVQCGCWWRAFRRLEPIIGKRLPSPGDFFHLERPPERGKRDFSPCVQRCRDYAVSSTRWDAASKENNPKSRVNRSTLRNSSTIDESRGWREISRNTRDRSFGFICWNESGGFANASRTEDVWIDVLYSVRFGRHGATNVNVIFAIARSLRYKIAALSIRL